MLGFGQAVHAGPGLRALRLAARARRLRPTARGHLPGGAAAPPLPHSPPIILLQAGYKDTWHAVNLTNMLQFQEFIKDSFPVGAKGREVARATEW